MPTALAAHRMPKVVGSFDANGLGMVARASVDVEYAEEVWRGDLPPRREPFGLRSAWGLPMFYAACFRK